MFPLFSVSWFSVFCSTFWPAGQDLITGRMHWQGGGRHRKVEKQKQQEKQIEKTRKLKKHLFCLLFLTCSIFQLVFIVVLFFLLSGRLARI